MIDLIKRHFQWREIDSLMKKNPLGWGVGWPEPPPKEIDFRAHILRHKEEALDDKARNGECVWDYDRELWQVLSNE